TFLVLLRKAAGLEKRELLGGWLHETAWKLSYRAWRANVRHRERVTPSLLHEPPAVDSDPAKSTIDRERARIVEDALMKLPERYRTPLKMHYIEGRSHDEVARTLGLTRDTVRGRLNSGRERLRRRLVGRGIVDLSAALAALGLSQVEVPGAVV